MSLPPLIVVLTSHVPSGGGGIVTGGYTSSVTCMRRGTEPHSFGCVVNEVFLSDRHSNWETGGGDQ